MLLFVNVVLCCVAAIQVAHALPHVKRIVIDPHITSPDPATVWTPGNDELVMWDTSTVPPTGDYNGTLLLGYLTGNSENLDLEHPLAVGFSLRDGSVRVTCPEVSPANNYIVILLGDSGNASPQFTISGTNQSSDSVASPPEDLAASPSNQPSSTDPVSSSPSTSTHTSQPATTPTSGSHSSALTALTLYTTPSSLSPHTGNTTPGTSTSSESSSASAASSSPSSGLTSNNAIPQTLNPGAITAGAVVAIFAMFF